MSRKLDFSPALIIKEKDGSVNTAVVVDNGPALIKIINGKKEYTNFFNEMIEQFPNILTASFYDKNYTSYRIKLEGEDLTSIINIKKFMGYVEKEEEEEQENA